MEPIDDGTVDKGRELLGSVSESISYWREAEGHVKVPLDSFNEEFPAIVLAIDDAFTLYSWSDVVDNSINIFSLEKISNLTRRKKIVNVHKEPLVCDLSFGE